MKYIGKNQVFALAILAAAGFVVFGINDTETALANEQSELMPPRYPIEVQVLSPNGGDHWPIGTTQQISWNRSFPLPDGAWQAVYLLKGQSEMYNPALLPAGDSGSSVFWTIPQTSAIPAGSDYKIRVKVIDGKGATLAQDDSDRAFTIGSPVSGLPDFYTSSARFSDLDGKGIGPALLATVCNSGPAIYKDLPMEVDVNGVNKKFNLSDGFKSITKLEYGCVEMDMLLTGAQQSAVRNLNVVTIIVDAGNFAVVESNEFNNVYAATLAYTGGKPSVTVLSPNGGERVAIGSTLTIRWQQQNVDKVMIGYKACDSCLDWIAADLAVSKSATEGSYNWTVPSHLTPGSNYRIEVIGYNTGVGSASDRSDSTFTIVSGMVSQCVMTAQVTSAYLADNNTSWGFYVVVDAKNKPASSRGWVANFQGYVPQVTAYGKATIYGNFFVSAGSLQFSPRDEVDSGCATTITVSPPTQSSQPSIAITAAVGSRSSTSSLTMNTGETVTISGTPQGVDGLPYFTGYTRAFFFDSIFNNACTNNSADNRPWTLTCAPRNTGNSNVYVEIYRNGQTYRSNIINITVQSPTAQTVTVLSPNGGEQWAADSVQTIRWTDSHPNNYIYTVFITNKNGGAFGTAGNSVRGTTLDWAVGKVYFDEQIRILQPGNDYYVQIVRQDGLLGPWDQSDAPFSIVGKTTNQGWLSIKPDSVTVPVGQSVSIEAMYQPPMPECPSGMACSQVMPREYPVQATWTSANTGVASVGYEKHPTTAYVRGVSSGATEIKAIYVTSSGVTLTATAKVLVSGIQPTLPGTLIGRIQIDGTSQFIRDPSGPRCRSEQAIAGFAVNYQGENGATGSVLVNQCNPQPFYSVNLQSGIYKVWLTTPAGWRSVDDSKPGSSPRVVYIGSGTLNHQWFLVERSTDPVILPGTLLGRIQTDDGQFIRDPSGTTACRNELVGRGFVVNYAGPVSGTTTANACNPEPYYAVSLPPGAYNVWLTVPEAWDVVGSNFRFITIENARFNHQWFQVSPKSDVIILPPILTEKVTVRAKGTPAFGRYPVMELREGDGQSLASWEVSGEYQDYIYNLPKTVARKNLRVYFVNDYFNRATGEDRNLTVDYLRVIVPHGNALQLTDYQSEDSSTFASGVWRQGQGCINGYGLGETLHCNGYFEYPTAHVVPQPVTSTLTISLDSASPAARRVVFRTTGVTLTELRLKASEEPIDITSMKVSVEDGGLAGTNQGSFSQLNKIFFKLDGAVVGNANGYSLTGANTTVSFDRGQLAIPLSTTGKKLSIFGDVVNLGSGMPGQNNADIKVGLSSVGAVGNISNSSNVLVSDLGSVGSPIILHRSVPAVAMEQPTNKLGANTTLHRAKITAVGSSIGLWRLAYRVNATAGVGVNSLHTRLVSCGGCGGVADGSQLSISSTAGNQNIWDFPVDEKQAHGKQFLSIAEGATAVIDLFANLTLTSGADAVSTVLLGDGPYDVNPSPVTGYRIFDFVVSGDSVGNQGNFVWSDLSVSNAVNRDALYYPQWHNGYLVSGLSATGGTGITITK